MSLEPDDKVYKALQIAIQHPVTYGLVAGVARFVIGDKSAGWKAFLTNICVSMFVALAAMFWLQDETYSDGKKAFFILFCSFVARDLLVAVLSLAAQFGNNPLAFIDRLRTAFKGGGGDKHE